MTAVLAPPARPSTRLPLPPPPSRPVPSAQPGPGWARTLVRRWPVVLALVSFGIYVGAGCFMLYSVHYAIGDALSRSEDARAVLFSRDPHLAAWGFVWFPGPVVLQLPFMAIVSPLNHAELAGPLSTATCGALTVLVMVRLLRRLGLSEPVVAGLTFTYCLNPVIIFYCGNGMSEASFYLTAAVTLLGVLWWYQEGGAQALIVASIGLAAAMTIREEALALVPLTAVLVSFRERSWARRAKVATLVALPGAFVFALWTFANLVIMGDALFWYKGVQSEGVPPAHAAWLPAHKSVISGLQYASGYVWAFVPALVIVLPVLALVVWPRRRRFWALATVVGPASVFPGQVAVLLAAGNSWGDPRYFASLTIFATVVLGFAASEVTSARQLGRDARRALCLALVCLGAVNAISGTLNDLNPAKTPVESESIAFRAAFGLSQPGNAFQPPIIAWRHFDAFIDPYLGKGQLIMVDTGTDFPAVLFSTHPRQWVIPSDRDFQKLAENAAGQFQWLLQSPSRVAFSSTVEIEQALTTPLGGHWRRVKYFGTTIGQLYRWVPDKRH